MQSCAATNLCPNPLLQAPQPDGNQERKWPEMKEEDGWDMDIAGKFFGGMAVNRQEMMVKRPHWCTCPIRQEFDPSRILTINL